MSTAIKAVSSINLTVENCTFSGLDIDIELQNVDGFVSRGNRFSRDDPKIILNGLCKEIFNSNLSENDKKSLFKEVINLLSEQYNLQNKSNEVQSIRHNPLRYVGNKGVDYFIQLAAAVSAGLIIRKI